MVGSLLQSCSEINDKQIVRIFESHRAALDRIAKIGLSSDLSCNATDREVKCNNATAQPIFEALSREAGVKAIRARSDIPQLGNAVYFVIADYGFITTNSYSKGIVYSAASLSPVVDDTQSRAEMRFRFRPIADHWYVFVMP